MAPTGLVWSLLQGGVASSALFSSSTRPLVHIRHRTLRRDQTVLSSSFNQDSLWELNAACAQKLVKWAASNYTMLSRETSVNLLESALPKNHETPALPLVSTGRLNPSGNNQVPMFSSGYQTQRGDFTSNGNIEESFQTHPLFIYSSKTLPTQRWPGHHLPLRSGHVWSITVFFFLCVFF